MNIETVELSKLELLEGFLLAPVGLCITRFRRIVRCNDEFAHIFGLPRSELEACSLEQLYPTSQDFEQTGKMVMPILQASGRYSDDRLMKHRNGHLFWCHVAGRSFSADDPYAHAIWMFEDLSDRRKTNVQLTPRERDVVKLLARGWSSKQVAKSLEISHRTVEAHRMRIGRKLDVSTTVEIVTKFAGL